MRYAVLLFVSSAAIIAYIQRTALSIPSKQIEADLGITPEGMGLIMGCWYWSYALFQIPAGWLTDRLGGKWAFIIFVTGWSTLTGLAGLATGFPALLLLWPLMGLAQTGLIPGAAKAIGNWLPVTGRAFGSGILAASMALGSAIAPMIAATLLNVVSWRGMLALYILPGIAWAIAFALIVPNRREPTKTNLALRDTLVRMANSQSMILLCTQQFFRASGMALFYTWFPRFLQESFKATTEESGKLALWPGLMAMMGGLLGGIVSDQILKKTGDRRLSRQGIAIAGMAWSTALALAAYTVSDVDTMIVLVSLAAFGATFAGVSGFSVCIDFGGQRIGTVISVMNMCGNIGAGVFPFAVGFIVNRTGRWDLVLPLFASLFATDLVCWILLNPKKPLFEGANDPTT